MDGGPSIRRQTNIRCHLLDFKFWWNRNFIVDGELLQRFEFEAPIHAFLAYLCIILLRRLHVMPFLSKCETDINCAQHIRWPIAITCSTHLWFFRFQFILLLDALDTATGGVTTILQCTTSLLHSNDFAARQSTQFQRTIQITYGDWYQFIIADIGNRARRQWCLQIYWKHTQFFNAVLCFQCSWIFFSCTLSMPFDRRHSSCNENNKNTVLSVQRSIEKHFLHTFHRPILTRDNFLSRFNSWGIFSVPISPQISNENARKMLRKCWKIKKYASHSPWCFAFASFWRATQHIHFVCSM